LVKKRDKSFTGVGACHWGYGLDLFLKIIVIVFVHDVIVIIMLKYII